MGRTYGCGIQINDAQIRVRIALRSIDFDGAADAHLDGLSEDELCERMDVEFFGVRGE